MAVDATIGGAASDTYVTLAEYTAYAAAMGWTLTGDIDSQEPQLRRARMALDAGYNWQGVKATSAQALDWPRVMDQYVDGYIVPSDTIPQPVKDAQCEMAYLIQGGADPFATVSNGAVTSERKKVYVMEKQTTYAEATGRDRPAYPAIDQLLADYVSGKRGQRSGSIGLMRA